MSLDKISLSNSSIEIENPVSRSLYQTISEFISFWYSLVLWYSVEQVDVLNTNVLK